MSTLTQAPSATILTPGTLAPSAIWMWAEILFNALLASSGCISFAPFFTHADFRTICATGTAVGWRCPACHPQKKTGSPTQTSLLVTPPASPPPPGFPPLPPGFYHSRPPRGLPRYPCSICSLEVGKDSLKCSTCSKWVHFSCSSLTRADFRKICAAGSPMGWNCPACLNGYLVSPTHRPASPRLVSPALPPPHTHSTCLLRSLWIHLCLYPHILPFLTPALLLLHPSCLITTASQLVHNLPPHSQGNPRLSHNLRIVQWNAGGLSSSSRAELIAFFLATTMTHFAQETHLFVNQNVPNP